MVFEDRLMVVLPEAVKVRRFILSQDCSVVAYAAKVGSKVSVFVGEAGGAAFDEVSDPVLSNSGSVVAYAAKDHNRRRALVVTNGIGGPEFDWVSEPVVSHEGSVVAYSAIRRTTGRLGHPESYYTVINNVEDGPFDAVHTLMLGGIDRTAYAVQIDGRQFAVIGVQKYGPFDRVARLRFDQRGRFYYWAFAGDSWRLFRDDKEISYSEQPVLQLPAPLTLAPDGANIAFWRKLSDFWYVDRNGCLSDPFPDWETNVGSPAFGAKDDDLAYVIKEGNKCKVVCGTARSKGYDAVGTPVFSHDGKILAFKAREGQQEFLVTDGNEGQRFDVIWPEEREYASYLEDVPSFSRSGTVAYRGRMQKDEFVVEGERRGPNFDYIIGAPTFGPASTVAAYGGMRRGAEFVVFGEVIDGPYDGVWSASKGPGLMRSMWTVVFSQDGKRISFAGRKGRELWLKTIAAD
jgi:hypothetical protein